MYYIISNPISGRKKHNYKKIKALYQYLDDNHIEYTLFESKYFKHPLEIAQQITTSNDSGNIIVIGGDGTFNEVVNGIKDLSKWNIGLIPSGSGNDFAKCLNLPIHNLLECLKIIINGHVAQFDYILVNDMKCVNVLGTGIDVTVLNNFEKHQKMKGSFRYFYSLLEALLHLKWYEFDVSLDDSEFVHKKGFLITLCNGSHIGGGIPICPNAKANDQKLEFVFVDQIKKRKLPLYLLKLMTGKIFQIKEAQHVYCEKAIFQDQKSFTLQIDGNLINNQRQYCCKIIKKGLNMYQ